MTVFELRELIERAVPAWILLVPFALIAVWWVIEIIGRWKK